MNGEWSRWGEFERREFREMPRKQGPETQTGRRFEASACWYNTRVKLCLMPLLQLPDPNSALAHRDFSGYHPRLITQRFSVELRAKERFSDVWRSFAQSKRPSRLPDLPRAATDPRRSLRDLRRQERIRGRGSAVSSGCQHGDGLEELEPTDRNDATLAPRRRFRLATIVPFDGGQPANGTPARVPAARGLLLAWQLTTHRSAELLTGDRG
jgi:hypothetical protein